MGLIYPSEQEGRSRAGGNAALPGQPPPAGRPNVGGTGFRARPYRRGFFRAAGGAAAGGSADQMSNFFLVATGGLASAGRADQSAAAVQTTAGNQAAGGAATFAVHPASIPSLVRLVEGDGTFWQDSARTTPATLADAPIGAWDDTSGLGNHLTQATAIRRPALKLAVVNGINAVYFVGTDHCMDSASPFRAAMANVPGITVIAVIKPDAIDTAEKRIFEVSTVSLGVIRYTLDVDVTTNNLRVGGKALDAGSFASAVGTPPSAAAFQVVSGVANYAGQVAKLRLGGVQIAVNNAFGAASNTSNTTAAGARLGANTATTPGKEWIGYIAAMAVFNTALSDLVVAQVERYFQLKYGL